MPRRPIDLGSKVRDLLNHVADPLQEADRPLAHYERTVNELWNLRDYVERKLKGARHYKAVVERHIAAIDRMLLVNLIEAFERFLKETAALCVDHVAPYVLDERFDEFKVRGSTLAAHFEADSLGKSLCESETWLDCREVNDRFRRLLANPFDPQKGDFYVFPQPGQEPQSEHFRHAIMRLLWQVRHTMVHNVGLVTRSDALKLRLLARHKVTPEKMLTPNREDLRYVKRFLDETAESINSRVAQRLADLLTSLCKSDSSLFEPQAKAIELAKQFGVGLTVARHTAPVAYP